MTTSVVADPRAEATVAAGSPPSVAVVVQCTTAHLVWVRTRDLPDGLSSGELGEAAARWAEQATLADGAAWLGPAVDSWSEAHPADPAELATYTPGEPAS